MAQNYNVFYPGTVAMRTYFSTYHLWAARHSSRQAQRIEDRHHGRSTFSIELRAFVTNSVLSAAAFLEAGINEVFDDIADNHLANVGVLSEAARQSLARAWPKAERYPILEKYQTALEEAGFQCLDRGQAPYQPARLLVDLRDRLTHARPKTQTSSDLDPLGQSLKSRFPPSKLMVGSKNAYFRDHCLGAGCAGWAVTAALDFADEFFARCGIEPNYQRVAFAEQ